MLNKTLITALALAAVNPLWAITCYYTLAKDNCWTKYEVSVEVMDAKTSKILTQISIPAGQSWARETFPCETNGQKLMYHAKFTPPIWETDKDKVYAAKNYWSLPDKVNEGDSAWNVPVCFPADFSEVPMPPSSNGRCQCDFSSIPEIKPKQL